MQCLIQFDDKDSSKIWNPPIRKTNPVACSKACNNEETTTQFELIRVDETTMFFRFASGRNFDGIDSQVFLPIITVFSVLPDKVTCLKCFSSSGISHGSFPSFPIPLFILTATTRENSRAIYLRHQ